MEFKRPKPKKNYTPERKLNLPFKNEKKIVGVFNGQFVTVQDCDSMNYLYESGNFGKGTLSKGQPNYQVLGDDMSKIMLHHQFENHLKWTDNTNYFYSQKCLVSFKSDFKLSLQSVTNFFNSIFKEEKDTWKSWKSQKNLEEYKQKSETLKSRNDSLLMESKSDNFDYKDEVFSNLVNGILQSKEIKKPANTIPNTEVIVLNPSLDSCTNLSLINMNASLRKLQFCPQESLNLGLEESFFLKSAQECLNIVDLKLSELGIQDLWSKFITVDKNFTERYITYKYYRKKGWVVKSGLKFGGDYLLYKDGPVFYHASYLVKILNKKKKLTWRELIAMNRLVETFNKELLLCEIVPDKPAVDPEFSSDVFNNHSVQEVLIRRWFPSKDRSLQENISI